MQYLKFGASGKKCVPPSPLPSCKMNIYECFNKIYKERFAFNSVENKGYMSFANMAESCFQ